MSQTIGWQLAHQPKSTAFRRVVIRVNEMVKMLNVALLESSNSGWCAIQLGQQLKEYAWLAPNPNSQAKSAKT